MTVSRLSGIDHQADADGSETPAEPWAIQLGESAKSFHAFCIFRDLPITDRTLAAAYRKASGRDVERPPGRWSEWARKHHWIERARAWDDYQDAHARSVALEAREADLRELRDTGAAMTEAGLKRLMWLLEHEPQKVSATAATRVIEVGSMIMRDAVVLPAPRASVDTSELVDELGQVYGRMALGGDREAAKIVLLAAQRKAQAEGTDAPQRMVGVVATLQQVLGGGSPDDIPAALQAQLIDFYRSQDTAQETIEEGDGPTT